MTLLLNIILLAFGALGAIVSAITLADPSWRWGLIGAFSVLGIVGLVLTILTYVADRKAATVDYAYGLALSGLTAGLDSANTTNHFEIRLNFQNKLDAPLKYHMTKYQLTLGGKSIVTQGQTAIITAKDSQTFYPSGGLAEADYTKMATRSTGTIAIELEYGAPEKAYARRLRITLKLEVYHNGLGGINEAATINWRIADYDDEAIK